jgi:hypothetical protein
VITTGGVLIEKDDDILEAARKALAIPTENVIMNAHNFSWEKSYEQFFTGVQHQLLG